MRRQLLVLRHLVFRLLVLVHQDVVRQILRRLVRDAVRHHLECDKEMKMMVHHQIFRHHLVDVVNHLDVVVVVLQNLDELIPVLVRPFQVCHLR
jgi:hypothetical protein